MAGAEAAALGSLDSEAADVGLPAVMAFGSAPCDLCLGLGFRA